MICRGTGARTAYGCMTRSNSNGRVQSAVIDGRAERCLLTASGFLVVHGWLADEGQAPLQTEISVSAHAAASCACVMLRFRRLDVEQALNVVSHDFGYLLLAESAERVEGTQFDVAFSFLDRVAAFELVPEITSEKRLLEEVLTLLGDFRAHRGRELALKRFLENGGRDILGALHENHVRRASKIQQCITFGARRSGPTFQTVLYGSMEAALFQPLLFAAAGICFGEWTYVCNSPQDLPELLRFAHLASKLHDLPIKVVVLSDNAGFGAANNAAISLAEATVVLVNPDVHVMAQHAALANEALEPGSFPGVLRGALLFYDDDTLMHGGMHLVEDVHAGCWSANAAPEGFSLLRVEHDDKSVPFYAEDWCRPRPTPGVTGALMAFERNAFEQIGGFSSDFFFGHYEDADLCLRWGQAGARVEVDPRLRFVHLEGQGSKTRTPYFHGASLVNRHIFDARVRNLPVTQRAIRCDATLLPA